MARMKLARGRISFQEIVCRMTITRRRFAQLGMGAACCLSTESLLAQGEGIMFGASDVPLVARDPAQDPRGISYGPARGLAFQELDMPGRRQ